MSQYSYPGVDGAANFFGRGLQLGQNAADSRFQQEFAQQQAAAQEEYRRQQMAERQAELYAKLKENETRKQANAKVLQKILGRGGSMSGGGMQMSPLLGGGGGAGTPPPPSSLPSAGSIAGLGSGSVGLAPQGALGAGIQSAVMPTQTPALPALGGMGGGMAPAIDDGIDDETLLNASPEMQKAYFDESRRREILQIATIAEQARMDPSVMRASYGLKAKMASLGVPILPSDRTKTEQERQDAEDEKERAVMLSLIDDPQLRDLLIRKQATRKLVEKHYNAQQEMKAFAARQQAEEQQRIAAESRKAKENEAERAKRTDPAAMEAEVQRLKAMYPEGDINKLRAVVEDAAIRNKREDLPTVNISGRHPITEDDKYLSGRRSAAAKEARDRAEEEYRVAADIKKTDPIKPPTSDSWYFTDSGKKTDQAKAQAWQRLQEAQTAYEKSLAPPPADDEIDAAIDSLTKKLGRPPNAAEVKAALQGTTR